MLQIKCLSILSSLVWSNMIRMANVRTLSSLWGAAWPKRARKWAVDIPKSESETVEMLSVRVNHVTHRARLSSPTHAPAPRQWTISLVTNVLVMYHRFKEIGRVTPLWRARVRLEWQVEPLFLLRPQIYNKQVNGMPEAPSQLSAAIYSIVAFCYEDSRNTMRTRLIIRGPWFLCLFSVHCRHLKTEWRLGTTKQRHVTH